MTTYFNCTFFCLPQNQQDPEDGNAFDLTWKDYIPCVAPAACLTCLPSTRKQAAALLNANAASPHSIEDYLDDDHVEFEALLNGPGANPDEEDAFTSFLTGNPFGKRGKKARDRQRRAIMPAPSIEGEEAPFEIFPEEDEEQDAEFLPDEHIYRFTQGLIQQPTDDELLAEERAAELEEEAEIQRKRRAAKEIAKAKGLIRDDLDTDPYGHEGYNEYDGEIEQELQDHPSHTPIIIELPPDAPEIPDPAIYRYEPVKSMSTTLPLPNPPRSSRSSRSASRSASRSTSRSASRTRPPTPLPGPIVAQLNETAPTNVVPYAILEAEPVEMLAPPPKPSRNHSTSTSNTAAPVAQTLPPPTTNVLLTEKLEDLTEKLAYIKKTMMGINFDDEGSEDGRDDSSPLPSKGREVKRVSVGRPRSMSLSMWDWSAQRGSATAAGKKVAGEAMRSSVDLDSIANNVLNENESPPVSRRHSSSTPTNSRTQRKPTYDPSRHLGQAFAQSSSDSPFFGDESPFAGADDQDDDQAFPVDLAKVAHFLQENVVSSSVHMFNRAVSVAKTQGQELQKSTARIERAFAEAAAVVTGTGDAIFRTSVGSASGSQQNGVTEGGRTSRAGSLGAPPASPKGDWIFSSTVGV